MTFPLLSISILLYTFLLMIISIIGLCILVRKLTPPYPDTYRSKEEKGFYDPSTGSKVEFPSIESESTVHLSVVVPAYNEEDRLPPMLDECLEFLEKRKSTYSDFKYEVIIVSDGSKDKTIDVALKYSKQFGCNKVRALKLEKNRGKGGAVYMGVQSTRGAVILFADADGATKFEDIEKLEKLLEKELKCNYLRDPNNVSKSEIIVCGSRAHLEKDAIATRSHFRNFLMHGFHFLVWFFAVRSIRDTQCGFKLLTKKAAYRCFHSLHVRRWAFDVELLYIAERLQIKLLEVAVRWTEIEGSKLVPVLSWLQMGKDIFFIWFKYKIGAWRIMHCDKKTE